MWLGFVAFILSMVIKFYDFDQQVNTERAIRHAIQERLPIVVVINKVDFLLFTGCSIAL